MDRTRLIAAAMLSVGLAGSRTAGAAGQQPVPRPALAQAAPTIGAAPRALATSDTGRERERAAGLKGNPGQFFGPDDYPPEALRAGEQGRVVAALWIDLTGKVESCTVIGSSGSSALDQATCRIALAKVTFTPAHDRRGRPIAARYTLPVRWVLPAPGDAPLVPPGDVEAEMTVSIDATGQVLACNSKATPPGPAQFGPCAEFPVGRVGPVRWMRDGKPVGGTMVRSFRQRVTLDP